MLAVKPSPAGLDRSDAALLLRTAEGCLGYHEGNARLGIPEPPALDPLCGAASLAASLRSLGLGYDEHTVRSMCYVDEEGSNLQNLIDAGRKLGAAVHPVSADDQGLMMMPKPAIAYVEQDHFVSVIRADKRGVAYLCSDCGAWPGGEVDLTWKQWNHMEPGIYAAVVRPGGVWDQFFTQLPNLKPATPRSEPSQAKMAGRFSAGVRVSSLLTNKNLHLASVISRLLPVAALIAHLSVNEWEPYFISCGPWGASSHCCLSCGTCPMFFPFATAFDFIGGPSTGDPVNLATGEEEYEPPADLSVYNPIGPSVSWGRIYDSLRAPFYEPWYEFQDFGNGWSQNYNFGVEDPTDGGSGPSNYKYFFRPNGGRIEFTAPSVPTAANPSVACTVQPGFSYLVNWKYNSSSGTTYYVITDSDRTQYVTSPISSSTLCGVLTQMIDRNGNYINFNYTAPVAEPTQWSTEAWPLLASITDSNGSPLMVINRVQDGTGAIASVDDRYGRTVYYHVGYYAASAPKFSPFVYGLDYVSQIEPTDTANAPFRYQYGYANTANTDGDELPKLSTISVPNPSGSTTPSTATISYDPTYATVESVTDGNGNAATFESVNSSGAQAWGTNFEKVTNTGVNMPQAYSETYSFNSSMAGLTQTDGAGNQIATKVYGDANNPYSPTTVTDANGKVWTYTYTTNGFGDEATEVTPRGTTTTNTWSYANFGLGEVTESQESYSAGGTTTYKAPNSFTYYEPSGLTHTITKPKPGTVNSSSEVTYSYTYNSLGDMTQMVTPGNNSTTSITDTFGYGSTPQIGQVLTSTDNLGHSTTFTYDNQANVTSRTDALGYTTYYGNTSGLYGYNIANQNVLMTFPATGESGTGNSCSTTTYLYPGGPAVSNHSFNEAGTQIRQTTYDYGPEGERTSVSGSTETADYTYDANYRQHSLTDGNGNVTTYYYNEQGYLDSVTYPGYAGPTPVYSTTTGTWSNVAGADSERNARYDGDGDVLTRVDGRGVTTTYSYTDPENKLTGVSYNVGTSGVPSQASISLTYDGFGRLLTANNGVTETLYGYTSGSTTYPGYDDLDKPLNVQTGFYISGSIAFSKNVNYTYYNDGSKASTVTPAGTFSYDYDGAGRPSSETNPFSETTSWSYLNNNWLSGQTLGDGGSTAYTRDAKAQITQLENYNSSSTVLSNFNSVAYDGVGNRTAEDVTESSDTTYSGNTTFTYDNKNELTAEYGTRNGGYDDTYVFDPAENPTTFRSSSGKTYNADNQRSNTGFSYDGNGNPTTYSGNSAVFDVENRMTSYGSSFTAGYDSFDIRAWSKSGSTTTYYLYADNPTLPVCELNSSGTVTATNTDTINGLVSRNTSSGSTFYEFDPQGTVAERLNSTGSCTVSSVADASGGIANSGTVSDPFGYIAQAGYYTDQQTGLILTTFRYYDSANGRFINRDPLGYAGGVDLYNYTKNGAENYIDPSGEFLIAIAILETVGGILDATGVGAPIGIAIGVVAITVGVIILNNTYPSDGAIGSISVANPISKKGLPQIGPNPFIPRKNWKPTMPLPNINGSYPDVNGNLWKKGPNHHFPDEDCEWDVTNPKTGKHINVGGNSGTVR
jgi:RHS repeat-associated protein